jgi:hypothetical protein
MPGVGGGAAARRRLRVDWGSLLVATALAGGVVAYLLNARGVSLSTNNLLLVQPVAILALVLYLAVVAQCFRYEPPATPAEDAPDALASRAGEVGDLLRIAALAVCFGLFILGLETVGFDVSAWLFTLVALWLGGERRWTVLVLFPIAFAVGVILLFRLMMPYPMTTLLL